jgi:hypothetical protein
MLYHLLIAGSGIVLLMGLWIGVQRLARRDGGDCDGPEHHSCGCCQPDRAANCSMRGIETGDE